MAFRQKVALVLVGAWALFLLLHERLGRLHLRHHLVHLAPRLRTAPTRTAACPGDRGKIPHASQHRRPSARACSLHDWRRTLRHLLALLAQSRGTAHVVPHFARSAGRGRNPQLPRGQLEPAAVIPAILGRRLANPRCGQSAKAFSWSAGPRLRVQRQM